MFFNVWDACVSVEKISVKLISVWTVCVPLEELGVLHHNVLNV